MHRACWVALAIGLAACGAESDNGRGDSTGRAGNAGRLAIGSGGAQATGGSSAFGNGGGGQISAGAGGQGVCSGADCDTGMPRVPDQDGFTVAEGDCDDFTATTNPGAFDVPGNGIDEDCQGGDATNASCDDALAIDSSDAMDAARAMELCPVADDDTRHWGVISARWTTPDGLGVPGDPIAHGLLPTLGAAFAPRAGKRLLAISSGVARAPDQAGFIEGCSAQIPASSSGFPEGFDWHSPSCEEADEPTIVVDAVALEVELRVPTNASALSFDSAFFTGEYPVFVCSQYNDYFQVIVLPKRQGGSADANVVFDLDGNPVSVNNSLLRVCAPGSYAGKTFDCPLGREALAGTGYEDCGSTFDGELPFFGGLFGGGEPDPVIPTEMYGASTGWLSTELAVKAGETITMRITIWDSGDSALDSLAVVDNARFRLLAEPPPPDVPVTMPVGPD